MEIDDKLIRELTEKSWQIFCNANIIHDYCTYHRDTEEILYLIPITKDLVKSCDEICGKLQILSDDLQPNEF